MFVFNIIGKLYLYNYPSFYDVSLPGEFATENPNLRDATNKQHVTSEPYYMVAPLTSLHGQSFTAFAKFTKYNNKGELWNFINNCTSISNRRALNH